MGLKDKLDQLKTIDSQSVKPTFISFEATHLPNHLNSLAKITDNQLAATVIATFPEGSLGTVIAYLHPRNIFKKNITPKTLHNGNFITIDLLTQNITKNTSFNDNFQLQKQFNDVGCNTEEIVSQTQVLQQKRNYYKYSTYGLLTAFAGYHLYKWVKTGPTIKMPQFNFFSSISSKLPSFGLFR